MQKAKLFSNNNELIFENIVSKFLNVFDRINFFLNKNNIKNIKTLTNYSFLLSTVFESFPLVTNTPTRSQFKPESTT